MWTREIFYNQPNEKQNLNVFFRIYIQMRILSNNKISFLNWNVIS